MWLSCPGDPVSQTSLFVVWLYVQKWGGLLFAWSWIYFKVARHTLWIWTPPLSDSNIVTVSWEDRPSAMQREAGSVECTQLIGSPTALSRLQLTWDRVYSITSPQSIRVPYCDPVNFQACNHKPENASYLQIQAYTSRYPAIIKQSPALQYKTAPANASPYDKHSISGKNVPILNYLMSTHMISHKFTQSLPSWQRSPSSGTSWPPCVCLCLCLYLCPCHCLCVCLNLCLCLCHCLCL